MVSVKVTVCSSPSDGFRVMVVVVPSPLSSVVSEVIVHDPDKCVLCGLCYRTCDQVVGKTFLGLYNRGFSTVVNPMVPDEARTFCASCLKCVEACPTGAMRSFPAVERKAHIL